MDTKHSRRSAARGWGLAVAFALAVPVWAQDGGDRDAVEAQLAQAAAAVDAASQEVQARQAQLEAARESLSRAERARDQAADRLTRAEAQAAKGRVTRRQVDQDRQSADRAIEAVRRASEEIQALEAAMNDGQASLQTQVYRWCENDERPIRREPCVERLKLERRKISR